MKNIISKEVGSSELSPDRVRAAEDDLVDTDKSFWDRLWPVIACGAGLFSDGYLNGVRIINVTRD